MTQLDVREVSDDVFDVTDKTESRPRLEMRGDDHKRTTQLAEWIAKHNDPPHLFQRARELVRLAGDGDRTLIEEMGLTDLVTHLNARCRVYTATSPGSDQDWDKKSSIQKKIARAYMSRPSWSVPQLHGVRTGPIYGPDLELQMQTGYHDGANFYVDLSGTQVAAPPSEPDDEDVQTAIDALIGDAFVDFPLADRASEAHLLAVGLTLVMRPAINGPTPLHLVSAPREGSGKGMLLNTWSIITQGAPAAMQPVSDDDEEWRKAITAMLLEGSPLIVLDNLPEGIVVDSPALASALTTETWKDRRLGQNEIIRLPNRSTWCATGNNPQLTGELARRTVLIRLLPDTERPDKRDDFVHDPLIPWVQDHRPRLIRSLLTLVEAWKIKGCPAPSARLGSYESWVETVGGVLAAVGYDDAFLANADELREQAASQDTEWEAFVRAWEQTFGHAAVDSARLRSFCDDEGLLHNVTAGKNERGQSVAISRLIGQHEGRVYGDKRVTVDRSGRTNKFVLQSISDG